MNPQPDLSSWLTEEAAATQLGVSTKTLLRQVEKGQWNPRMRPREGKKPERVFSPAEVSDRMPGPVTEIVRRQEPMPTIPTPSSELSEMPPLTWPAVFDLVEHLISAKPAEVPKIWIRLKEASEITGLTVPFLRRLIEKRKLDAVKDVAIKVRRESLDGIDLRAVMMKPKKGQR